jgi:hypothetical protein
VAALAAPPAPIAAPAAAATTTMIAATLTPSFVLNRIRIPSEKAESLAGLKKRFRMRRSAAHQPESLLGLTGHQT